MEIKASDVAKLRQMTGSGMMDCKNALVEANGDFDRAQEIIREKGKLVASKRADRETKEGAAIAKVSADTTKGILVCLGCETDFVSKTEEFRALSKKVADAALANLPADTEALLNLKIDGATIAELISQQTGKTGEKHQVAYYDKLEGALLTCYNHMNSKVSSLVAFNKALPAESAKYIAMQTAAMSPVSVSKDDCPKEVQEKELRIGREQAKLDGKPEAMIEKIAQGKLNRFFKDSTLLAQDFINDGKITVEAYLKSVDKDVTVTSFRRFSLND
ncbi:MAG: translation elongation factor Ts [Prevotellaceae bacterium]|jgi:elongation factor Ts|nr:translation elongation factor Ts [Prevotellaceae bacterium]